MSPYDLYEISSGFPSFVSKFSIYSIHSIVIVINYRAPPNTCIGKGICFLNPNFTRRLLSTKIDRRVIFRIKNYHGPIKISRGLLLIFWMDFPLGLHMGIHVYVEQKLYMIHMIHIEKETAKHELMERSLFIPYHSSPIDAEFLLFMCSHQQYTYDNFVHLTEATKDNTFIIKS